MSSIGGYFELELKKGEHYHKDALRLNTARNCFEYILRAKQYKKVFIPYYTCEVMLEPLHKLNIEYEFYHITEELEPQKDYNLQSSEAFLYTNYYGLKQSYVKRLARIYGKKLIVDNAQAFYAEPLQGIDTFYSARKFFGVADGAYLYTDKLLNIDFKQDYSYNRMSHLLKRIDLSAEDGYKDFQKNDDSLINQPIKLMSKLTDRVLRSIDYIAIGKRRRENYNYLHSKSGQINKIKLEIEDNVPMVYPFLIDDDDLKHRLINNKIYVATYWNNVLDWCKEDSLEYKLTKQMLPLAIDQRYDNMNMNIIKLNLI
ncbi:MAG: hypothetical protein LKE30_03240 [Bacteroidales bacterium]|jgi:hypothetical protein|nr:hypothetical protein [Bacteroidales bacterium]